MWARLPYYVTRYVGGHTVFVFHKNCIQRSAVTLSYQIYGDDNLKYDGGHFPIFLVHDLLGSKKDWSMRGKVLSDITGRPVVAIDLRNHGSSPHAASHKYMEMADDLLALFKKMELKKASLVGFSMGGRVSMTLALVMPEKVSSLLIIDISPVSSCTHLLNVVPEIMDAMKNLDFKGIQKPSDAKNHAKLKLRNLIADDNEMNSVLENLGFIKNTGTIGWICNLDALINNFDYIKDFPPSLLSKAYDGPTLFVGGQHSEYIPPDDLPLIRELFPRAVVKYLANTGHNLQTEDPKSFLELATTFLKTNTLTQILRTFRSLLGSSGGVPVTRSAGNLSSRPKFWYDNKKGWMYMSQSLCRFSTTFARYLPTSDLIVLPFNQTEDGKRWFSSCGYPTPDTSLVIFGTYFSTYRYLD